MRRILAAGAAVLVLQAPAAAMPPPVWAGTFHVAEAAWVVREGGEVRMYYVFAYHLVGRRSRTRVFAGSGPCRLKPGRPLRAASCTVRGRERTVPPAAFSLDPQLGSARLRVPGMRVTWAGRGYPQERVHSFNEGGFFDNEIGLERRADAWGRLLGRRLGRPLRADATLGHGGFAGWELPG